MDHFAILRYRRLSGRSYRLVRVAFLHGSLVAVPIEKGWVSYPSLKKAKAQAKPLGVTLSGKIYERDLERIQVETIKEVDKDKTKD